MTRRFEDSWLKLDRAAEQHGALEQEILTFLRDPEKKWLSANVEEDYWKVVRFRKAADPPKRWSILAGELAVTLRSVLDHLVFTLSDEAGGNPDDPRARTQWPIFTNIAEYPKWR
jgi:hypothetical protein